MIPTYETQDDSPDCQIQAFLLNFSSFGGLIWTTFMAIFLYRAIKGANPMTEKTFWIVFLGVLVISMINSIIPFVAERAHGITSTYGKTRGWCWIQDQWCSIRYSLFFGPLFFIIFANFTIYILVKRNIEKTFRGDQSNEDTIKKIKNKLLLYPVILIFCYMLYSVKALLELTIDTNKNTDFILTLISGVLRCLHGFLNFLIYGLTTSVQKKIRRMFRMNINESYISLKKSVL
jgi:hypothetical protein